MSKNLSHLSFRQNKDTHLFEVLVGAAAETGTVSVDKMRQTAHVNLFGESSVMGAVSFYDFLKEENEGKKVFVCNGTACLLAGTQDRLHEHLKRHIPAREIGEMCCLGRCHENRAFQYQGVNYSAQTDEQIDTIIDNASKLDGLDNYAVGSNLETPILTGHYGGVQEIYRTLPDLLRRSPEDLLAEVTASQIRGRGGAGFPAGIKWKTCREASGDKKYIVCNADEGDPGAYTDRYLMEKQPHLVLFGMIVAGYIVGSDTGILYIRGEYPESVQVIRQAIDEIAAAGYIGADLGDSGFTFHFHVIQGAGAYICGEETALLASIEGQRPEVRTRPPFPAIEGLYRRPTIVNNVETFALVYPVLKMGGEVFRKIGTDKSTGSKLVSLDSHFKNPGVYEIAMGTPLSTVLYDFGGGFTEPVKALHIGGPLGGVVPSSYFENLTLDFESFAENGFLLGHGSILAIPETFDMLAYMEHLFAFTAAESCGKCFPCRLGSVRGEELTNRARTRDYLMDRQLLVDLIETLEETSLCALGGGVPLPLRNILDHFGDELQPYFAAS